MENVVEDKEVPPSSTAEAFVAASASPGTDDLDPVHLEALDPVHLEALDPPVHLEAQGPGSVERECARQEEARTNILKGDKSDKSDSGGVDKADSFLFVRFRRYYTLFMVVITLENLFSLPVEMMMPSHDGYSSHMIFSLFCDIMFLTDIALNFRMGILSNDCEVEVYSCTRFGEDVAPLSPVPDFQLSIALKRGFALVATYSHKVPCVKLRIR
ncbi:hypothetical protein N1851_024648 [Merluccius polli]|uniref:Uncharacterized protein n=1 Tax=Merluccius polli TaxID=89951 RepID=A0AA47MEI9_MERPO|nr:hypothetical protein N1851_024648 [Merluccius polli]